MSKLSHASSRRMYSWWWDSHISPQNSRWLVENLTDMDVKVKSMIKLIEQDADSFASRAEMYYEKRPELMKMVEEFYRAYRALAEKYNHATGALRQAHWTITENFPNQLTSEITEDELEICSKENNPQAPEDSYEARSEDRKGLEQFNGSLDDENIGELSKVLAKFEAEKEFSLAQYKKSLEKLSHQEREFSNAQESSKGLAERASKSEDEVESLRKTLKALESENEKTLVQYQKCLENIEKMEGIIFIAQKDVLDLNEGAYKAETEAKILKIDLATLESEKATSLDQCKQYLEKILNLEHKLVISEDEAKKLIKIAEEAKAEAESVKQDQYQNCSDIISNLEQKLSCAQEKVQMLNGEVKNGVVKLKGAEEHSIDLEKSKQYLHVELETLKLEMGAQSKELTVKRREIDLLLTSIEDERTRFAKAETDFQLLQLLQAQTEKELNSLSLELENRSLIVSDLETRNQSLNELNIASSLSLKDMQSEISSLKEVEKQLKKEVKIRVDQKNTLQQEIHCLKEELNDLYKKYQTMLDQVEGLQNENLNLKETRERESKEKVDLSKKLENLEKVDEKNALLQNSLSNTRAEFEGAREEIIAMVKSIQSLFEEKNILDSEKASLVTQLQVANENLEKLSEKNNSMENIIYDAHDEIEGLKMRLKDIEDSCERLEDIEKKYWELEEKHSVFKREREFTLCEVEELRSILKERKLTEDKQIIEIENLHGKFLSTKKTNVELQEKNLKLIDEKISLVKNFLSFQGETNSLDTASLDNLSLIFKNIINEKGLEIEELRSTVDKLTGTLESLEKNNNAKDKSIELLIEKISILEGENGKIEARLAGYVSAISSLKDSISSLENITCFSIQLQDHSNEQVKATIENHVEGHNELIVGKKETDKLPELQVLEERIKIIEKTVIETFNKLEAATRQIEELGSKDIVLDQKSNMNGEERIIKGVHFDLGVTVEKELGVDKVATAKRFSLPNQELDKTMILDGLNSDSQKLTDLQITIQDLRRKCEMSEKLREGKSFGEYERRLKKADEDITQLSDLNGALMKSVDKSDDVKDVVESEESRNMRKKISEEAREVSERIGQLEFEVQTIQYIMLKLGDESGKESISRKSEITEIKKTSFRNYLGLKTSSRTKKRAFCGFVHPPTIED